MLDIEYISTFVKGFTFGATLLMALTMFTSIRTGHKSRWRRFLLGVTGVAMLTHTLTIVYRLVVDVNGYSFDEYFTAGAIMLDMLCIAPMAIIEVMLTRHTVMSMKSMLAIYSPFVILIALHFITGLSLVKTIAFIFAIIASVAWSIMTYKDMRQYNAILRQTYSNFEGRDVSWLARILLLLLVALCIWAISTLIGTELAKAIYRIAIVLIWFALCRRVYIQKEATEIGDLSSKDGNMFGTRKPLESPIDPRVFLVGKEIDEMMRTKQLFKQYDITTLHLAQELNCNKTLIAQYFASKGTTFHTYVNDMRLDYAAEQLLRTTNSSMEIAKNSGYQFDSVFYRAFQQKFGCTPHDYRRKYKTGNND